MVDFIRFHF